jgi:VanZ family protein
MKLLGALLVWAFAIPALWRVRWAYVAFVALGLLYLPAMTGFRVNPQRCDFAFNTPVLIQSLSNYPHIIQFSLFFLVTVRQFRSSGWQSLGWSTGLTMLMGAAVEIAEGVSGLHHCKAIDLVPDFIGAMLGVMVVLLARTIASAKRSRRNDDDSPHTGSQAIL